jgi:hypothetical protein
MRGDPARRVPGRGDANPVVIRQRQRVAITVSRRKTRFWTATAAMTFVTPAA